MNSLKIGAAFLPPEVFPFFGSLIIIVATYSGSLDGVIPTNIAL